MRNILCIALCLLPGYLFSQETHWQEFPQEAIVALEINKTATYQVERFTLDVVWDKALSHSANIGAYAGIKKLRVFKANKLLQTIDSIEDVTALGTIHFSFYDYNLDGYIDFSIPLACGKNCAKKYYLFNPKRNQFEHIPAWDYLSIQKIDKSNKLLLSQPDGNAAEDNRKIYQIKGLEIKEAH
ncbi:hypothetical protein MWU59_08795 [Flavobacteriaceae bacterium F08102]|nr:hypothetical protein [Flavobacteriaceae bacterium F08102]